MAHDLGKSIRTLKAQKDITNKDIAQVSGKSVTTVSQWVNGKQAPSLEVLDKLGFFYNVDLSTFIKWGE